VSHGLITPDPAPSPGAVLGLLEAPIAETDSYEHRQRRTAFDRESAPHPPVFQPGA